MRNIVVRYSLTTRQINYLNFYSGFFFLFFLLWSMVILSPNECASKEPRRPKRLLRGRILEHNLKGYLYERLSTNVGTKLQ